MISVEFMSSGSVVRGYFFPAPGDTAIATIVFLQGFPGVEGDELICERLAKEQVNVLTFNYRGVLQSTGYFSFSNAVADIGAALRFLKEPKNQQAYQIDPEKIVLGGWSFGSSMVPAGAVRHAEIQKIFGISGRDFGKEAQRIQADPAYAREVGKNLERIRAPEGPVNFRDDLLGDLIANQATFAIEKLAPQLRDRDVLLVGGWDDEVIAIEDHLLPMYRFLVAQGAKEKIEAFQDDHEFSTSKDQLVQVILKWLKE